MRARYNLKKLINKVQDVDMVAGLDWYKRARVYCYKLSLDTHTPYSVVCGMLAALSPRNRWERNKVDVKALIEYLQGKRKTVPLFGTYHKMVEKAESIYFCGDNVDTIRHLLKGPKITSFYNNIYDTDNSDVTVDTWMHLAALGKYMGIDERPILKKSDYNEIESTIKDLALQVELRPYELQAVLWCAMKRINGPAAKDQK